MATTKVVIRKANQNNLHDILSIIKQHQTYDVKFAKRYYDIFFSNKLDQKDEVYVAFCGKELVGVIGYFRDYFSIDYSYSLGWFGVKAKFRRNGIGTRLLRRVERDVKTMRDINRKLFVSTEDTNKEAKCFYTENGFRTEGVIRDYYGDGEDQLIMSKLLS